MDFFCIKGFSTRPILILHWASLKVFDRIEFKNSKMKKRIPTKSKTSLTGFPPIQSNSKKAVTSNQ